MPRTPKQWKTQLNEKDKKDLAKLCELIDEAMDNDRPMADSTRFVFNLPKNGPVPSARLQAEIVALYKKSADRPDGWSDVHFKGDAQDGAYISFEA